MGEGLTRALVRVLDCLLVRGISMSHVMQAKLDGLAHCRRDLFNGGQAQDRVRRRRVFLLKFPRLLQEPVVIEG
jgi:hypothetical protein